MTVFNYIDVSLEGLERFESYAVPQAELPMEVTIKNQEGDLTVAETVHKTCVGARDNNVISIPAEAMKVLDFLI